MNAKCSLAIVRPFLFAYILTNETIPLLLNLTEYIRENNFLYFTRVSLYQMKYTHICCCCYFLSLSLLTKYAEKNV